jgi:enediyne biosynthesis protein E4
MRGAAMVGYSLLLTVGFLLPGCRPSSTKPHKDDAPSGPVWFRDDTAAVGLNFEQQAGPTGSYFMPQIMGSGGGLLLDYEHDDQFYLYLVQNAGPHSSVRNQFFRWRDGHFEDVTAGSGLDIAGYGMGVAVGDFDNDGHPDIYVSQFGGGRLFHNRGNNTFEDVTKSAGVELPGWGTSCCFVDYDRDGWLDLVVVHYLDYDPMHHCGPPNGRRDYCHPSEFAGQAVRLFHNRGRDAHGHWRGFEDVTEKAGLSKRMPGLGVVCADFTGDGWPDILAANDAQPNCLWVNRHNGTFAEEAVIHGVAYGAMGVPQSNMGVTLGDVFGDGRLDLFITHLTEETHTLWRQIATGVYDDRTVQSGLSATSWRGTGFGTILADFDLGGAPDIAVVNGRVSRTRGQRASAPGLATYWQDYAERNQLFMNDGHGHFTDISLANAAFCGTPAVSRGLLWADFAGNGRIDLISTSIAGPARFYRNVAPLRGHWLSVRAIDPRLHRDAYGAVVTIHAGGRHWVNLVNPGQSYLSSGDPRVHFGLGAADHVERIRIDWPDGLSETFPGTVADRSLRLERGKGKRVARGVWSVEGRS